MAPPAGYVNVRRDVTDQFYRYRMPILLTKIEGKGNGIKTVIPNMADVSRALNRPSSYPTKFFGCELGAQATFNDDTERYIVNGAHEANRLRDLLDSFIDKFVLCASCKNPETELIITKDEFIIRDCKACGQRSNVDMRHKLTTFIVKNPPKSKKAGKGRKAVAGADSIAGQPGGGKVEGEDDESDDELTKKIEAGAAQVMSEEQAQALIAQREKEDDWSIDTSKEAVAARVQSLDSKLQNSLVLEDDDEEGGGPYETFGEWVKEQREGEGVTDADIYKKAEEMGIAKKHKSLVVLVQAIFTEKIVEEIAGHVPLFGKMTTSEKHQKSLLGGIERFVGEIHPDLIPSIPKILMAFYQADILEEEVLTQWGTHVSKKYVAKDVSKKVRKASEPFIKWLAEADSDEESDDE
ncbi:translation initiation factor [Leucosporidium creatinivorum]|uniref:Translation initiation factor n=1 Tax=Leucosporidium creatinivorum TaxID=106004 RepID=A0A1Y2D926_9BASI|nr:translation initiation factor [Leucosporidium creatinivorum]